MDVAVTVRLQVTCDSLLSAMSVCQSGFFFIKKIFTNLFQTGFAVGDVSFGNGLI